MIASNNVNIVDAPRPLTVRELRTLLFTYHQVTVMVNKESVVGLRFDTRAGDQYCWVYKDDLAVKDVDRLVAVITSMQDDNEGLQLKDARQAKQVAPNPEEVPASEVRVTRQPVPAPEEKLEEFKATLRQIAAARAA